MNVANDQRSTPLERIAALRACRIEPFNGRAVGQLSGADIDDCGPHEGRTFDARHANGIDFSDDVGDDVLKISLHNHWKADSMYVKAFWVGLGTAHVSDSGFSQTSSSFEVDFKWAVPGATYFGYYANVHVTGPKGLSPAN